MQTRMNITLPQDLARGFRIAVPRRQRSRFIASLLKEKLKKRQDTETQLRRSLKANYEYDKKIAEEWSVLDGEGRPEWEGKL